MRYRTGAHLSPRTLDRLIGGEVEPQLRPLFLSIATNFSGLSVLTTYFGPWLLIDLHAPARLVAEGFFSAGLLGAVAALFGGWLSDQFRRRPVIILSGLVQIIAVMGLVLSISCLTACILFAVARVAQSIRGVGQRALLADLSSPDKMTQAFAGFRLSLHTGLFSGPIVGAMLIWNSWRLMFIGVVILNLISFLGIRKAQPVGWKTSMNRDPSSGSARELWKILGDSRFILLFLAALSGWMVVYSYEIVLPLQLVQSHVLTPQSWGCIFAVGPILVIFFQLRLGKWMKKCEYKARMLIGSTLMGAAFLILLLHVTPLLLIIVTMIFIVGDMLWGPTGDSIVASVAPERSRGIYMGMAMMGMWLGSALAPLVDLYIQVEYGSQREYCIVLLLSMISAGLYILSSGKRTKEIAV